MFILNLTKEMLTYRAHGEVITLKPGINCITGKVTKSEELKNHFRDFISVVGEETEVKTEEPVLNRIEEPVEEPKTNETEIVVEEVKEEEAETEEPAEEKEAEEVTEEPKKEVKKPTKKATKKAGKKTNKK